MKSILSTAFATAYCVLIFSCGNSDNNKAQENNTLESAISSVKKNPDAKGDNKCLLDFQQKYDELLSEEDILTATGFNKDKLKTEYGKFMDDPAFHSYTFDFENGRVGKIPGTDREMEQSDYIGIKYIEEMSFNQFEYNFKVPTEEDVKVSQDVLDDVVDGKIEDEAAKDALKRAEENNVSKDAVKSIGSAIIDGFAKIAQYNVKVDNLGDAAVWNSKELSLNVLKNGVKFCVESNVSNDEAKNKEVAIGLAKIILDKCK